MARIFNLSEYRQSTQKQKEAAKTQEWHTYAVKFWFLKDDGYWDQDVVNVKIQGGKDQHEAAERQVIANHLKQIQVISVDYQS